MRRYSAAMVVSIFAVLLISGCATIGRNFEVSQVKNIQLGKTTQNEILSMFGTPWRTGIEDGKQTWTYGRYHYGVFSETAAKDLVIRYDDLGIVVSYTYNTTDIAEDRQ
ncbi:MAG: hypothetical protein ABII64_10265 [Elusimicrobiota bacterium]